MGTTGTAGRGLGRQEERRMIFMGESDSLMEAFTLARKAGVVAVERPDRELMCVVADEDLLNGFCTPLEADILRRARRLGVPCLNPHQAHALLASVVHRVPLMAS